MGVAVTANAGSERAQKARIKGLERELRRREGELRAESREACRALEEQLRGLRSAKREQKAEAKRTQKELREQLRSTKCSLRAEAKRARAEADRAEKLEGRLKRANEEIQRLRGKLEQAQREKKRQAAPFSKGEPKAKPKKPGRKKGKKYGRRGKRKRPAHVDDVFEALLPESCPDCGGIVTETDVHEQTVTDAPPVRPHVTQFNVHVGCCEECGARVQGRHPRQHSDALGAAAHQIGPVALVLAAHLNKVVGASYEKIAHFFLSAWGIGVTPSALARALKRLAKKGDPVYGQIEEAIRRSPTVYPDETGWKVNGLKAWLWAFVGEDATLYRIEFSRGFEGAYGSDPRRGLGRRSWPRRLVSLRQLLRRPASAVPPAPDPTLRSDPRVRNARRRSLPASDQGDPPRSARSSRPSRGG